MKQLTMFVALNTDGGDRITYFYDIINNETGSVTATQERDIFFVLDETLRMHINAIREYIKKRLGNPLYQLTSFMALHMDDSDRISLTYDKISPEGKILSVSNDENFVVLEEDIKEHIAYIREWITKNKLSE